MYPNQSNNPFGINNQGFGTPVNQMQQPVFPHQTGGQPFYSNQSNQNFGGQSAGYFPPPPAGMYQNAVRPVSIETMNHIRSALWDCINKSDRNNDLVAAANNLLANDGQLLEGLLRLGANYVALCQSRGMDYAQCVNNTAVVIHGAQIANQRRNFPHFVQMYPQISNTLDQYIAQFQHILQATGVQSSNPMPAQHVQMTGAGQFQGTSASLGGQPPRSPQETIPQSTADVSISIVPPMAGMGVRVGTMPIRSVTNQDGSRSDYMDLVNAAKQRAKELAALERAEQQGQFASEQSSNDFYGNPTYAQQQQPTTDAMAELRRKQNEVGQNNRDVIRQYREEHAARIRAQQEKDQYLDQAVENVQTGTAMPNWSAPQSATTGFKLPHELSPQQTMHGGTGTIYQTEEGVMEEIPVTFKHPGYTQPATQPQKSAIDQAYEEVFGPSEHDASTIPDFNYPKTQPASWSTWGLDKELDREELARAGIVSHGPASSGLDTSPLVEMEDSHIAQHYNDAAIQNGSIKAMDEFAKADHNQIYPGIASMSLMDITNLGNHEPAKIPTEQPQALHPEQVALFGGSILDNAEPFQSMVPERKRTLLGTKEHRGIAPVYIAGRQRVVVIKSLGGGKITVEGNAKMNYDIHETELLGSQTTALTGKAGDINIAQSVLTRALETAPESHYRKLLEDKIAEGADLTDLLVDGPMLEMSGLVNTSEIDSYAPAAQAALYERLGDRISEVSLDASINFNAFTPNRYVLSDDSLTAALAITRAKTATTIAARAMDFFDESTLPAREIHRLHKITTDEVNRLLKVTFHPDYEIESFTGDVDDISTLLHENGEENVRDKLAAIYAQAVKTTLSVHTLATLKKRLADAEVETGLVEGEESGIFAKLVNVTLMPFNYADYPLAFEGAIGRLTKDGLPKLYEVLDGVLKSRTNEGVHKFVILTEDHQIIEFFKPVVEDDQAIYISRG